jgi:protein TonB
MKIITLIFLITSLAFNCYSQSDSTSKNDSIEEVKTELFPTNMASFPGGEEAINRYIAEALKYPEEALENDVSGTVYISFVIDTLGNVTEVEIMKTKLQRVKAILNSRGKQKGTEVVEVKGGTDYCLGTCAANIISNMPKWEPATVGNRKVRMRLRIPIKYALF